MIDPILHLSPNYDSRNGHRVTMLVLHYTGMPSGWAALERLSDPQSKVSSHYLVEEDGRIFLLVDEANRAWHAGVASWRDVKQNINAISVGIEIVNPGHEWGYRAFPAQQMQAVMALARDVIDRHNIAPTHVVGHSDIAPDRKDDPGELFDWDRLAAAGLCIATPKVVVDESLPTLPLGSTGDDVALMQIALAEIGYAISTTGSYDAQTEAVMRAFQRRFRRTRVTGLADPESCALIAQLSKIMA